MKQFWGSCSSWPNCRSANLASMSVFLSASQSNGRNVRKFHVLMWTLSPQLRSQLFLPSAGVSEEGDVMQLASKSLSVKSTDRTFLHKGDVIIETTSEMDGTPQQVRICTWTSRHETTDKHQWADRVTETCLWRSGRLQWCPRSWTCVRRCPCVEKPRYCTEEEELVF